MSAVAYARLTLLLGAPTVLVACGAGTQTITIGGPPTSTIAPAGTSNQGAAETPAAGSVVHFASFRSPSGNIGCVIVDGSARCDIVRRSWALPARPTTCPSEVDYGQGLILTRSGVGRLVCAGDTARDLTSPKLAYGSTSQVGDLECASRVSGLTCTERLDGHGFF